MKNIFLTASNAIRNFKTTLTHGGDIDAYEDALNVYEHALNGQRYSPENKSYEPLDQKSDDGKAFIEQAKDALDSASQRMEDIFSPR